MYKRRATGWKKHLDFIALDVISLHIALILVYIFRNGPYYVYSVENYRRLGLWMTVFSILAAILFDTMHNVLRRGYGKEAMMTLLQSSLVFGFSTIFLFAMKNSEDISRIVLWGHLILYSFISYVTRVIHKKVLVKYLIRFVCKREMLLICDRSIAEKTIPSFLAHPEDAVHLLGVILTNGRESAGNEPEQEEEPTEIASVPVVAKIEDAADYILREWIDEVYIAVAGHENLPTDLIEQCGEMGVTTHVQLVQLENAGVQRVERIADQNVITDSIAMITPGMFFLKRAMDIAGGLVLSFFALLAMAVIAIPLKKASPGPVLYKSERIGQNGKRFYMYKIRSMKPNADQQKEELMDQNRVADGLMFKLDFDPRIIGNEILPDGTRKTGIGQKIRDMSIDELPQGFNVLLGHMSLVGTRPPTPDEWEKYEYHHRARLAFKPGLTGLWQVSGRSQIRDFEEVVKLDTKYITKWNLSWDIRILFQTVFAVLRRKGAM